MTAVRPSRTSSPLMRLGRALAVLLLHREVAVDRARERGAEADQVRAALDRVDVVREAVDALVVRLVVLDRDLDRDRHLARALRELALAGDEDRRLVERRLALVQVLDERDDAALVAEVVRLAGGALVVDLDAHAGVQERELAQPLREHVERELGRREDLGVGLEGDLRAVALGRADRRGAGRPARRAGSAAARPCRRA